MASVICDSFMIRETEANEVFRSNTYKPLFDNFFAANGSSKIFVYYQPTYKINESGEVIVSNGHSELVVTEGDKVKLIGKGVYFMRSNTSKAVNVGTSNDSDVMFGEISEHTVNSLNTVVNKVYKPLIAKLDDPDWGQCENEQKGEFLSYFDKFANELREAIKSLQANISLEPYPSKYDAELKAMHNGKPASAQMISEFDKIFTEWREIIEEAIKNVNAERKDEKNQDPRKELEYWRNRMRILTGISEQLASKNCITVYDALQNAASSNSDSMGKSKDKIRLATSSWKTIQLRVTE